MNAKKTMGKYHCLGLFFIAAFSGYVIFNLRIFGLPQNTKKKLLLNQKGSPWPSTTNRGSLEAVDEVFLQDGDTFLRYVHPYNSSIIGKMTFKLKGRAWETGKELIEDLVREYKRKPVEMESVDVLPKLIPVSAISSNHFKELMAHVTPAKKILPHRKMIVYDLGLSQQEIDHLKSTSHIEYRKFNFSRFPEYVKDLHTYAFKPLIIAEMLAQFGGVLWMDASVIFGRNCSYQFLLQRMVKQGSGFLFYLSDARKHHSILFATHKHMFDYLPMKGEKEKKANMPQATGMILFNTKYVIKHVMKWVILCSLIEECIAPKGARLKCDFSSPDRYNRFGGCHRYDQSLFSIVVSNAYNDQPHMYRLNSGEYPARVRKRV